MDMTDDRYITLAIHTYEKAVALRGILASHDIDVRFENVSDEENPKVAIGVKVRIHPADLALALKLIESGEGEALPELEMKMAGISGELLIPVDFSDYSMLACRVGFALAQRCRLKPVVIHSSATPYFEGSLAIDDDFTGNYTEDIADMQAGADMQKESERLMRAFKHRIKTAQGEGTLPDIKFSTILSEGIPEDVILQYCRMTPPALVVMATRGIHRKERDLIGSVTAEVLDSCRVPVLAVPQNYGFTTLSSIKRLAFFCNLDQNDILSVDTLLRLFDYPEVEITLIPVNPRSGSRTSEKIGALRKYMASNYPAAQFHAKVIGEENFRADFEKFEQEKGIQLMVVPNRKKNILSRLFNPGMAHKLLFEREIPLLALPV